MTVALIPDDARHPVAVQSLVDGSLDGVILTTSRLNSTLPAEILTHGFPVVTVNREVKRSLVDSCAFANAWGAGELADFLVARGHRRFAAVFGPSDTSTGRDRERGFRSGLGRHGLTLEPDLVWHDEFTFAAGATAATAIATRTTRPTALFCSNDLVAIGAIDGARAAGLSVPGSLSIVGFDDIEMAAWRMTGLTTMRCDLRQMARRTAELLMTRIRQPDIGRRRVVIRPALAERTSHRDIAPS